METYLKKYSIGLALQTNIDTFNEKLTFHEKLVTIKQCHED